MDWVTLVAWPVAVAVGSLIVRMNFFWATVLFFGGIGGYLSLRRPAIVKRALKFTLITFLPMTIVFDYLAWADFTWYVPNSAWRFLNGAIPVEDAVWSFVWMYAVLAVWEYFFQVGKKTKRELSTNMKYLLWVMGMSVGGFFLVYFWNREWLKIEYFYLKFLATYVVIPISLALFKNLDLGPRLVKLAIYFFFVSFLAELVGLKLNHWYFAGENYLGVTRLAGHLLPFEEILAWWMLAAPSLVSWYKLFADDSG